MSLMRIAVKRTDLECIMESLDDANRWFQRIAWDVEQLRNAGAEVDPVPDYIIKDTAYFRDLCAGIINHAPRVKRGG